MSEAVYERYKDALRRGHVAALRGRLDDALAAYAEAASIAPDRPLPYASMGGVQLRLERVDDALASFGAALDRAPRDEAALVGRADALARLGRRVDAAEALDLASDVREAAGRPLDALETARRALELAESRARRRRARRLIDELRSGTLEPASEAAIARATVVLDAAVLDAAEATPPPAGELDEAGSAPWAESAGPGASDDEGERSGSPGTPAIPVDEAGPPDRSPVPDTQARVEPPPGDPIELTLAADVAIASGDPGAAREALLAAAAADAAAGLTDSALDACYRALAVAPDDADLHLALVDLYVGRGWTSLAARKLALLERLVTLDGDDASAARIRTRAASAFLDAARADGEARGVSTRG